MYVRVFIFLNGSVASPAQDGSTHTADTLAMSTRGDVLSVSVCVSGRNMTEIQEKVGELKTKFGLDREAASLPATRAGMDGLLLRGGGGGGRIWQCFGGRRRQV